MSDYGDMFHYEALGISRTQLKFLPRAGEDFNPRFDENFDYIGALFEAAE
ncbi:alanyl-tRNA synthetase [Candidatus Scalindua japonica]|uniref:Alanyl-tRNA synthetase n=1 Tax=Candidatus Scalindua japonica TaxID=1284222 RepID=A0A286U0P7_9BACT|nr:hypothetical protein [Candidatus Scalindua japonica]GAX61730.1 alanyl-tRNA synthetase [Candidatus Scalindua japonica]